MWRPRFAAPALGGLLLLPIRAFAHEAVPRVIGPLVDVDVQVDGRLVPLYSAPDGSGRLYLEAREGSRYALRLRNRSGERVGVALDVDGLNVISGERAAGSRPPRMYILDPWRSTTVRGWRTSLDEVRHFTFVDESRSYAARSDAFNGRIGWIEVAVYRQRTPDLVRRELESEPAGRPLERDRADAPAAAPEAPRKQARSGEGNASSFPGTGWGQRTADRAILVDFDPEQVPFHTLTLRYEYADTLRALGVLTASSWDRDRLRERELGSLGFARPPAR
jgi:hypothetical protein